MLGAVAAALLLAPGGAPSPRAELAEIEGAIQHHLDADPICIEIRYRDGMGGHDPWYVRQGAPELRALFARFVHAGLLTETGGDRPRALFRYHLTELGRRYLSTSHRLGFCYGGKRLLRIASLGPTYPVRCAIGRNVNAVYRFGDVPAWARRPDIAALVDPELRRYRTGDRRTVSLQLTRFGHWFVGAIDYPHSGLVC